MQVSERWLVSALLISFLLFSGIFAAISLNSDLGNIEVKMIFIREEMFELSGLLYKPVSAKADEPATAVILAHGIGGSKEMMSGIGLELARRGFVSLCLDLYGHGQSQGTVADGWREPSFGVSSAVSYLRLQPFVNSSSLILVGHSLGAGAVRAAARDTDIAALVLIGGGLDGLIEASNYVDFNTTFPKNLLVIVGKYDILFDISELTSKVLPVVFGVTEKVVPGILYGDFSSQTARKFVISPTIHLFEPLDPTIVHETINWVEKAAGKPQTPKNFVYLQRELGILMALSGVLGTLILTLHALKVFIEKSNLKMAEGKERLPHGGWYLCLVWGSINLALFILLFIVGLYIFFPPLIFGSSVAWWLFGSGLLGLIIITEFSEKILDRKIVLKNILKQSFAKKSIIMATMLFLTLYVEVFSLDWLLAFHFRIIVPILKPLSSPRRVLAFAAFVPFLLPYFIAEGLYLNMFTPKTTDKKSSWSELYLISEKIFCKIAPIIFLLFLQYITKISLGYWLIPGFFGFLLDFLWLIIPIFIIAIIFSSCLYETTGEIFSGAFFDALLLAWIASTIFPF